MFHFKSLLILSAALTLAFAPEFVLAQASSAKGGGDVIKRAERRESQRWTLKEWLEQKDRNRMMDIWLSMNSPSPYELMLGLSYNSFTTEVTGAAPPVPKYTSYQGSFAAYAQFVGLGVEYENNTQENFNDLSGLFNLRLIGSSIQGSYLALHYGLRTRTQGNPELRLAQQFAQASLQLYVIKQFGFDGHYRYYLPTSESTLGDIKELQTEVGAFIDFKNFRIFGSWYKETQNAKTFTTETDTVRSGIRSGLKFFF